MNDRDADIAMAGLLAGLLLFGWALTSCLCHVPRGPQRCAGAPTVFIAGGTCPIVDDDRDGGAP